MPRFIQAGSDNPSGSYDSVPVFSLVAAGGPFLDNPEARLIGNIYPPKNMKKLTKEYFLVRIEGHSMEPRIRSGSYCLMRLSVAGSRSGRTVLVEERKVAECAYTMKLYIRLPSPPDGSGRRGKIILRSDNPDQPDIELEEDGESQDQRYAVIAEFEQVIEPPFKWVSNEYE